MPEIESTGHKMTIDERHEEAIDLCIDEIARLKNRLKFLIRTRNQTHETNQPNHGTFARSE